MSAVAIRTSLFSRLWAYQAERFPVFKHGVVIAAFAWSAATAPALLSGSSTTTHPWAIAVAVIASFLFFLQLRVADEHKDYETDCRFRPSRPVPRGLVRLEELRWVAFVAVAAQATLATTLHPVLLAPLALVWGWMALMTVEFFAPHALKARPVLYMISHMAVMPLIALFGVACGSFDEPLTGLSPALGAFLTLAFVNGVAIEIARKCWAPEDERPGVETYSSLWGPRATAIVTAVSIGVGAALAALVQRAAAVSIWQSSAVAALALLGISAAVVFAVDPTPRRAKWLERGAGLWVLACHVMLGIGAAL